MKAIGADLRPLRNVSLEAMKKGGKSWEVHKLGGLEVGMLEGPSSSASGLRRGTLREKLEGIFQD